MRPIFFKKHLHFRAKIVKDKIGTIFGMKIHTILVKLEMFPSQFKTFGTFSNNIKTWNVLKNLRLPKTKPQN